MRETLRGLGLLPSLACPRFADVRQHFVFLARLTAMSRKHLLVIGLAFSLGIIGCGGGSSSGSNGGGNSAAISVKVSTAPPTSLQTGATATIAATISNDSANKGVTWSCAPGNACGSFNPTQTASAATTTYTAPANAPQGGTVTITATSVSDNTKTASASVSVTVPISVSLSTAPPTSLQTGATATIAATVLNDSANKGVTWSCAPSNACGSFTPIQTASGATTTYTAPVSAPQGGSVTITAASVSDGTKTATASVSVTAPPISITLSTPPPASLNTSAAATIAATVTNDSANKGVTWSCAPTNACGLFNPPQTASGASTTYTAPSSTSAGSSIIITANSVADNTKTASASVALGTAGTVSVVITTFPSQKSIQTGATAILAATVSNDATNAGVTWSCSVATGDPCGTFNPPTTASGVTTTYTAPSSVPQSDLVAIKATSVSDNTKSFYRGYIIYAPGTQNAMLRGQYAFLMTGQMSAGSLPWAGSVTLDGNGSVTAGEVDQPGGAGPSSNFTTPVTGTYAVGSDGRGVMVLSYSFQGIPGPYLPLSFALTSTSHGVISEADGINSVSGSLDLQSAGPNFSASQISGGYSFTLNGQDLITSKPDVAGGIFTADGVSNLTNGTVDNNDGGTFTSSPFHATFTAPDASGRGTVTTGTGATFVYYIVTPKVLRLLETDANTVAGGSAFSQGATTAFSNSSLTGNFVFSESGQSNTGASAAAGQFTANGIGSVGNGIADWITASTLKPVILTGSTYSIANSPRGTFTVAGGTTTFNIYLTDPTLDLLDPNNSSGGGGALILETDANAYGIGAVIPQVTSPAAAFTGNYVINIAAEQQSSTFDFELDLAGTASASGSNGFSGFADYAGAGLALPAKTLLTGPPITGGSAAGTFNADSANPGRFTGRINITPPASLTYFNGLSGTNALLDVSYYQASSKQVLFIQTDGSEVAIGILEQ